MSLGIPDGPALRLPESLGGGWLHLETLTEYSAEQVPVFSFGVTKPSALNTGSQIPDNQLIAVTGTFTPASNSTHEGKWFKGKVNVNAENVTFRNCRFDGGNATSNDACVNATSSGVSNLVLEYCSIKPTIPSYYMNGVNGHDFTMRRCDVMDVVDCVGIYNTHASRVTINGTTNTYQANVVLEGNYFHHMAYFTPDPNQPGDNQTHNDTIQIQGGVGVVAWGNTLAGTIGTAGTHTFPPGGPTGTGDNSPSLAVVMLNTNVGNQGQHVFTQNWIEGGYLPINCGGGGAGANLGVWHKNRFDGLAGMSANPPETIKRRSDQTIDSGAGTANQNVFYDGSPILVRTNG